MSGVLIPICLFFLSISHCDSLFKHISLLYRVRRTIGMNEEAILSFDVDFGVEFNLHRHYRSQYSCFSCFFFVCWFLSSAVARLYICIWLECEAIVRVCCRRIWDSIECEIIAPHLSGHVPKRSSYSCVFSYLTEEKPSGCMGLYHPLQRSSSFLAH